MTCPRKLPVHGARRYCKFGLQALQTVVKCDVGEVKGCLTNWLLLALRLRPSSACNLVMSGFFLILLHAQSTRARDVAEEEDIEAWATGALQTRLVHPNG
jgi:hypothetical protein